jgi:hypothetical protein
MIVMYRRISIKSLEGRFCILNEELLSSSLEITHVDLFTKWDYIHWGIQQAKRQSFRNNSLIWIQRGSRNSDDDDDDADRGQSTNSRSFSFGLLKIVVAVVVPADKNDFWFEIT